MRNINYVDNYVVSYVVVTDWQERLWNGKKKRRNAGGIFKDVIRKGVTPLGVWRFLE